METSMESVTGLHATFPKTESPHLSNEAKHSHLAIWSVDFTPLCAPLYAFDLTHPLTVYHRSKTIVTAYIKYITTGVMLFLI